MEENTQNTSEIVKMGDRNWANLHEMLETLSPKDSNYIHALLKLRLYGQKSEFQGIVDARILKVAEKRYGIDFTNVPDNFLLITLLDNLERRQCIDLSMGSNPRLLLSLLQAIHANFTLEKKSKVPLPDEAENLIKALWRSSLLSFTPQILTVANQPALAKYLTHLLKLCKKTPNIDLEGSHQLASCLLDYPDILEPLYPCIEAKGFEGANGFVGHLNYAPALLANEAIIEGLFRCIEAKGFGVAGNLVCSLYNAPRLLAYKDIKVIIEKLFRCIEANGFEVPNDFMSTLNDIPEFLVDKSIREGLFKCIEANGFEGAANFVRRLNNALKLLAHKDIKDIKVIIEGLFRCIEVKGFEGADGFIAELDNAPRLLAHKDIKVIIEGLFRCIEVKGFEGAVDFVCCLNAAAKLLARKDLPDIMKHLFVVIKEQGFESACKQIDKYNNNPLGSTLLSSSMGGFLTSIFSSMGSFLNRTPEEEIKPDVSPDETSRTSNSKN